jgi:hypothetical protein
LFFTTWESVDFVNVRMYGSASSSALGPRITNVYIELQGEIL